MSKINHSKTAEAVKPKRKGKRIGDVGAVETPSERLSRKINSSLERREIERKATVKMYSLRVKDGFFGVPFFAHSDDFALAAQKELLPRSDCYCIGSVCLLTGKVNSVRPRIVLDKGV